jgi:hypothetical protein
MDPDIESQKLVSGPGLERGGGPLATQLDQTERPDVNVASISAMLDTLSFELRGRRTSTTCAPRFTIGNHGQHTKRPNLCSKATR